jgi:undecaprenyldiphospho-muramoylpentapeptide beta-N-acetylglucosaminyltransferase
MTGTFAVLAGGGTAGHVHPALAIADALVENGHARATIHFIGAQRGMESRLVPAHGYPITVLDVRGLARGMTPRHLFANMGAAARLMAATVRCVRLFGSTAPKVVVSVGGYASLPPVLAALVRRIPVVTVSYDAVPGRATKLAARFAVASAVAFPGSVLPRRVVTGAPLRAAVVAVDRERDGEAARRRLGLPLERFVLLVVGGSHGSGRLNEVTRRFVADRRARSDLAVRHVTGTRDPAPDTPLDMSPSSGADRIVYQPVRYEDDMPSAYAAADVVLARAGATTVAELAALGLPSILVPWPLAAEDHQTANARVLADVGGAILVPDGELDSERLTQELARLADPLTRFAIGLAAASVGRRDGAARVAAVVEEHAR